MNSSGDLTPSASTGGPVEPLMMTLYVAGSALNSLRARANLEALCEAHFPENFQIEIVDIFEDALRALKDKVLVTPTLVKTAPAPVIRIIGDLRDRETVALALKSGVSRP
jgi:circadian clock protein KaiB